MKQHHYFLPLCIALTFAVFTSILITPGAHANAQTSASKVDSNRCVVTMVYLHGKNPPTTSCVKQSQSSGQITSDISGSDCSGDTLALRGSDNLGDLWLCFLGAGFVNLTDYIWRIWPATWNDRPNWFGAGCNTGSFFSDIDGNGTEQNFASGQTGSFDGKNGRLAWPSVSSFIVNDSCNN